MTAQDLKNSILQLAIRGKLVKQDPNDEPASELLKRIRAEKQRLIKEGKIKKDKNPSEIFIGDDNLPYEKRGGEIRCISKEIPFDIPESWAWCRLGEICSIYNGNSINETEKAQRYTGLTSGYNFIATKDVGFDCRINYNNGVRIPLVSDKFKKAPKNSVLLCIEGGSAGRKIAITEETVCFGNKLCAFVPLVVQIRFVYFFLQSPIFASIFKSNVSGIIGGVSINRIKEMYIPIPPLSEQKRIVEEIEKLLPFLEEYEKCETELTMLDKNFPDALKKSILQWAIQGRLVAQDPNDEPADILLERIRAEKEKLIKEGKIKRDKNVSKIIRRGNEFYEKHSDGTETQLTNLPFDIPTFWTWCRLGEIANIYNGNSINETEKAQRYTGLT
ncbi:MAG TPA: restriction endonuclease subunit S, partial [Firmicutes bacterium]|nr:restriction endonuclease subunit S [Bacillota bacterium]